MTVTMTDLFCGAGGSSSGAFDVGVTVRMAANHWQLAVDTHQSNHPAADHDCADVSQVDPRRYPATDILWASPECTNHSLARGQRRAARQPDLFGQVLPDEAAERSRATMWDVPRFAEAHRYAAVVVENVPDAAKWSPFPAWLHAMATLGYAHQVVWLNSMHAQARGLPAPQSRDRMYVVFHRGARAPRVAPRPPAWCPSCDQVVTAVQAWKKRIKWGRYRSQYLYACPGCGTVVEPGWLPAASVIDWDTPGQRIGDRARPLAAKTVARIEAGLRRYAVPQLMPVEGRDGKQSTPATDPLRTITTRNETALVVPLRRHNTAKPVTAPLDTIAASGLHHALVMRHNTARGDQGQMSTPVDEPLRTLTTTGHQSLIDWSHLLVDFNGPARSVTDVMPTATTVAGTALASREIRVEDCLFRMLTPDEIKRGMAFDGDYRLLGNRREQVRQAGNAVTPPAARDLLAAVVEALS